MKPKVSVIIPTYNSAKYIGATIESVLGQSMGDFELIICDDASCDDTLSVVGSYDDPRIRVYKNEHNLGAPATRNRLTGLSQGQFISVMDADDIALPHKLETQVEYLEKHPGMAMCGTWSYIIDRNGKRTGKVRNLCRPDDIRVNLLFSSPFIHSSVMFRADALDKDPYPTDYWPADDYALWCRLQNDQLANIGKFLTAYRWHGTNESVRQKSEMTIQSDRILTGQLGKLGISPTARELVLIRASFKSAFFADKPHEGVGMDEMETFFQKIIDANKEAKKYRQSILEGYIWARWFAFCRLCGRSGKALFPSFSTADPAVLANLVRFIIHFARK